MNARRRLVLAAVAAGLTRAGYAWAQTPARVAQIGWITSQPLATAPVRAVFTGAMRERGWIEGSNYVLESLHYEGRVERIPGLAAQLVQRRVDVIVVSGSLAMGPVMKATSTIPIVFLTVGDPVGSGFVSNLSRPGGNVTGQGGLAEGLFGKTLALLKQAVPGAKRIGVLLNPAFAPHVDVMAGAEPVAQRLGLLLRPVAMRSPQDVDGAFAALAADRVDAVSLLGQAFLPAHAARFGALSLEHRLPMINPFNELVRAGVLFSYGWKIEDEVRRLPYFLDRILNGAAPGDMPVEQPSRFYLVINLKAARALGLTMPQSMLLQAEEVIE
ncbi:MAG: ABC transporter substrate-binding protein [Caldimonas sp.]